MLFVLLVGAYLALSVRTVRDALHSVLHSNAARMLAAPVVLWMASVIYLRLAGYAADARVGPFAAYLVLPALVVASGSTPLGRAPVRELAAAVLLWLPIEFHLLPTLPIPVAGGYNAVPFLALVEGLYLFLIARPLDGVGYTYLLTWRDARLALTSFALFAIIAIPIGLGTRFLAWNPDVRFGSLVVRPILIYLVTAIPEELLFRGLIQNLLTRWLGAPRALPIAAVIFGLAHFPDPRYMLLATIAGFAYGWVYLRTGKITASAVTHALVDGVWVAMLRVSQ
ncbi:MAG TPA: type II CAAX endopeptidase family protein [Gemmatimonadaceae bacterium]|nr:type II CAAX endopeptidase family protein [Gemmatimonadaceae bacterium]